MENLSSKTTKELRAILKELGAKPVQGRASAATLIKAIETARNDEIDQSPSGITEVPKGEDSPHQLSEYIALPESIKPPASLHFMGASQQVAKPSIGGCSQEQVLEAVKNFTAKGMTVRFIENCWEFKMKDRMDTGNMAQPVESIKKCAEMVCREAVSASRMFLKTTGIA